jgi:diphthine-ammonia ligase
MKYIGLLSGGKDSCYNLVHCHKNGHELVAVASLGPEPGKGARIPLVAHSFSPSILSTEELDSYLYQTVGQDAIEFVARALEVPLYRRVISGSALAQGSEYGGRNAGDRGGVDGDETEDLYALLADVKVKQVLSARLPSPFERRVCCSPNIPTHEASRSAPSFQTTSASA